MDANLALMVGKVDLSGASVVARRAKIRADRYGCCPLQRDTLKHGELAAAQGNIELTVGRLVRESLGAHKPLKVGLTAPLDRSTTTSLPASGSSANRRRLA